METKGFWFLVLILINILFFFGLAINIVLKLKMYYNSLKKFDNAYYACKKKRVLKSVPHSAFAHKIYPEIFSMTYKEHELEKARLSVLDQYAKYDYSIVVGMLIFLVVGILTISIFII